MESGFLKRMPVLGMTAVFASSLILAACSSAPATVSNVDPTVDFSQYKTYAFITDLSTNTEHYQRMNWPANGHGTIRAAGSTSIPRIAPPRKNSSRVPGSAGRWWLAVWTPG